MKKRIICFVTALVLVWTFGISASAAPINNTSTSSEPTVQRESGGAKRQTKRSLFSAYQGSLALSKSSIKYGEEATITAAVQNMDGYAEVGVYNSNGYWETIGTQNQNGSFSYKIGRDYWSADYRYNTFGTVVFSLRYYPAERLGEYTDEKKITLTINPVVQPSVSLNKTILSQKEKADVKFNVPIDSSSVYLQILDEQGNSVYEIMGSYEDIAAGSYVRTLDVQAAELEPGKYIYSLQKTSYSAPWASTVFYVLQDDGSPFSISVSRDGNKTLYYGYNSAEVWCAATGGAIYTSEVLDSKGNVIRTLDKDSMEYYGYGDWDGPSYYADWNLKDNAGKVVKPGTYIIRVTARNAKGATVSKSVSYVVKNITKPKVTQVKLSRTKLQNDQNGRVSFRLSSPAKIKIYAVNAKGKAKKLSEWTEDTPGKKSCSICLGGRASGNYKIRIVASNQKGKRTVTTSKKISYTKKKASLSGLKYKYVSSSDYPYQWTFRYNTHNSIAKAVGKLYVNGRYVDSVSLRLSGKGTQTFKWWLGSFYTFKGNKLKLVVTIKNKAGTTKQTLTKKL